MIAKREEEKEAQGGGWGEGGPVGQEGGDECRR